MSTGFREELVRTARIVDQTLTGHSVLRDRFARRAFVLDLSLLILSATIAFLAFSSDMLKSLLLPAFLKDTVVFAGLSLLLFVISVVQWRVGWKERGAAHNDAASALSRLKHELAKTLSGTNAVAEEVFRNHMIQYQYINDSIVKIPEKLFLKLKRRHKSKVELSALLDVYPGASIWLLKFKVLLRDNFGISLIGGERGKDGNGLADGSKDFEDS